MTDDENRAWMDALCEDLGRFSDSEIAYACARYRQDPKNRFFPTPGQLLELCKKPFADPPPRSFGRQTEDAGWQPWGGGCQCDRCMKKTPRDGFFRASNADHARDAEIRRSFDYDMERQFGYDPKVGNPALDNNIDRQRTPEELAAILKVTRHIYPEVFNPGPESRGKPSGIYVHKLSEAEEEILREKRRKFMAAHSQ